MGLKGGHVNMLLAWRYPDQFAHETIDEVEGEVLFDHHDTD
jgi:hypothetical protein